MTDRLYYDNAYLWEFSAVVKECRPAREENLWEVRLNRSAFYPTSGGQPFDTGVLIPVSFDREIHVLQVEADREGEVWHTVDAELAEGIEVSGKIDGRRRTDHMEQHAGEHMLAGAIWETLRGTTIGLHLGKENSSIDVSMPDGRTRLTDEEIQRLEEIVNARIRMDAPIRCWFPSPEELQRLPLRKPPTVTEHVRIVAIGDFEMVACGGTHPSTTGRIGQLKILSALPARGKIRITFVCGERAERLFRQYMRCADKVGNVLSVPTERLASAAGELIKKLAEAERNLNQYETARVLNAVRENETDEDLPGLSLSVTEIEQAESRPVAEAVSAYISEAGKVLLLWVGGRLTFARSSDVDIDMRELIQRVGKGGGRADLAGGAGIRECVRVARKILLTEGKGKSWKKRI